MCTKIDSALNPPLAMGNTRSLQRPLSAREQMQRAHAACAGNPGSVGLPTCSGNLSVGLFFDGTGNNEQADYLGVRADPRHQKHSNVVRLFHAYPDQITKGTNKYRAYYIPGVGTPFTQIGDDGGTLGSATAWGGEPRIIWGLTRIFNAVHWFHGGGQLITDIQAKGMTSGLGGISSLGAHRRYSLKKVWQPRLQAVIEQSTIKLLQINLSVFGFSRGAAEARAFVNWLYEICEYKDGGYMFAGIPLRVNFLGIFDTVASVGLAGLYTYLEGRQSWADDNMEIHPGVESCLHLVAGHEVRACFPLDSVRVDGKYPKNVREYMFPGSHSDVGGGYMPMALGNADWSESREIRDGQMARIPGYEMYCAALACGVPLFTIEQLSERRQFEVAQALVPDPDVQRAVAEYFREAEIEPGPIEDMASQHMNWFFRWRLAASEREYRNRAQYRRARGKPNVGEDFDDEPKWLLHTQRALHYVVAAAREEIARRIKEADHPTEAEGEALKNTLDFISVPSMTILGGALAGPLGIAGAALGSGVAIRRALLSVSLFSERVEESARQASEFRKQWRDWLVSHGYPEIYREDAPERDVLRLLDALDGRAIPAAIESLLDKKVHDSMAGFIGFGMPEFEANGHGLAKYLRIYFGNQGDTIVRERVKQLNAERRAAARSRRAEIDEWNRQMEAQRKAMQPTIPPSGQWFPRQW